MTFAQGKLYEDRAALLNITSNTANQRVNKISTTMSEVSKRKKKQNQHIISLWTFIIWCIMLLELKKTRQHRVNVMHIN
jgi:hypothetical protein